MVKIVGSIINSSLDVIGLTLKGKPGELWTISESTQDVEMSFPLRDLVNLGYNSKQLILNLTAEGKVNITYPANTTFRLRDLPVYQTGPNGCSAVDNTAHIVSILYAGSVSLENTIGYELALSNRNILVPKEKLLGLSEIFKLDFKVVVTDNNLSTTYILGKPGGVKKSDLEQKIYNKDQSQAQSQSQSGTTKESQSQSAKHGIDLMYVLDCAKTYGGKIVLSKDTHYNFSSESSASPLKSVSVSVMNPAIFYSMKGVNANIMGTRTGILNSCGVDYEVPMVRTYSIIKNGKKQFDKLDLAIPTERYQNFLADTRGSFAIQNITKDVPYSTTSAVSKVLKTDKFEVVRIDLENIEFMSDQTAKSLILSTPALEDAVTSLWENKANKAILSGFKTEPVKTQRAPTTSEAKDKIIYNLYNPKELAENFQKCTREQLLSLLSQGVNPFTGYYQTVTASDKYQAEITIEYKNRYTSACSKDTAGIIDAIGKDADNLVPQGTIKLAAVVNHKAMTLSDSALQEYILAEFAKADEALAQARTILAKHKIAMCELTNYAYIHSQDKSAWVPKVNSRLKSGTQYLLVNSPNELQCDCKNILIK